MVSCHGSLDGAISLFCTKRAICISAFFLGFPVSRILPINPQIVLKDSD